MAFRDEPFHIDGDLAYVLCEQFNGYASVSEDIEMLDEEFVLDKIQNLWDPETIAAMVQDDFGRGILMGMCSFLKLSEAALTAAEEQDGTDT